MPPPGNTQNPAFPAAPVPTPAPAPARFRLTVDQLHLLDRRCPGLTLPPEFRSEWTDAVPEQVRAERESTAEAGLVDAGLLQAAAGPGDSGPGEVGPGEAEFVNRLDPAVRGFLALFTEPALLIGTRSWGEGRTIVQTIAVAHGFAVSLVRGQRLGEHGRDPVAEDAVELSAFAVPALVPELLRPVRRLQPGSPPAGRPADAAPNSIVLPVTVAQGLVGAIRSGRPEVVEAAARQAGRADAASLLHGVAFGLDAGFTLAGQSLTGDSLALHWFRSTQGGWFELAIDTPGTPVTPVTPVTQGTPGTPDAPGHGLPVAGPLSTVAFVDASRVRIATSGPAAIVARLTIAVGTLTGVLRA